MAFQPFSAARANRSESGCGTPRRTPPQVFAHPLHRGRPPKQRPAKTNYVSSVLPYFWPDAKKFPLKHTAIRTTGTCGQTSRLHGARFSSLPTSGRHRVGAPRCFCEGGARPKHYSLRALQYWFLCGLHKRAWLHQGPPERIWQTSTRWI